MTSHTRGNPPDPEEAVPGYRQVLYWRIGDKRWQVIAINLLALLSLPLWLLLFGWFGAAIGRLPQTMSLGLPQLGAALAGGLLTLVLHEMAHGWAMMAVGARPRFGVLWSKLMFYATAPGHVFRRSAYLAVGLAPLVSLSLLALAGMLALAGTSWVTLLVLCAALNAAGAAGDLWIMGVVLRYPSSARLIDERDGVRVLLPA